VRVTSSLLSDALTTLANLKSVVGIASADTSKDAYLEMCINRATGLIEEMTNRKSNSGLNGGLKARRYGSGFSGSVHPTTAVPDEDYLYFSGMPRNMGGETDTDDLGRGVFYLPAYPVQANSVVTFALAVLYGRSAAGGEVWDETTHAEFDTFTVDRGNGVLRMIGSPFVWGEKNYRIKMAAGFQYGSVQPFVPSDLEGVCLELAKRIFRDNRNVTSESLGTWSRSFDRSKEDPFVTQVIAKYSRISL
jgi:hypothetical protein